MQRGARDDEDRAHDEGAEDAPEQHPVLVRRRHREVGEDHQEDEDVVDRQGLLDQVAGQELQALGRAEPGQISALKREGERHPDHAPGERLAEADLVGLAVEDAQVERQHHQHERREPAPEPHRANRFHLSSIGQFHRSIKVDSCNCIVRVFRCMLARMEWLNYHHLLYFWMTARHGSMAKASAELRLAPPTLSRRSGSSRRRSARRCSSARAGGSC